MGWPLPGFAHIPGQTRAADNRLTALLAEIDKKPDRLRQRADYGCQLFEAGFYWEAHEVWEPVWHAARPNSAAALLVQAAIALANAALKIRMHQPRAARRLLQRVSSLLAGCPPAAELKKLHPDRLVQLADWLQTQVLDCLDASSQTNDAPQQAVFEKANAGQAQPAPDCAAQLAQLASGLSLQPQ